LTTLHQKLAVVLVLGALAGTIWSAYRGYRSAPLGRLRLVTWVMSAALLLQGAFGAALGLAGGRPAEAAHFVIGPLTVVALPVAVVASSRLTERRASLILAVAWALTFVLALRATGSGGLAG
jgi:hypothetical protein